MRTVFIILLSTLFVTKALSQSISDAGFRSLSHAQQEDTASTCIQRYMQSGVPSSELVRSIHIIKDVYRSQVSASETELPSTVVLGKYRQLGDIYSLNGFVNIDSGLYFYDRALKVAQDLKYSRDIVLIQIFRSSLLNQNPKTLPEAMSSLLSAVKIAESQNDEYIQALLYSSIGCLMGDTYDTTSLTAYYCLKGAYLFYKLKQMNEFNLSVLAYISSLNNVYSQYNMPSVLRRADSLSTALRHFDASINFLPGAEFYVNAGYLALNKRDTAALIRYADSAEMVNEQGLQIFSLHKRAILIKLFSLHYDKKYEDFVKLLHSSLIAQDTMLSGSDQLSLYDITGKTFAALHQYDSAYHYTQRYNELRDSLQFDAYKAKLYVITTQYNLNQKQVEIDQLERADKEHTIIMLIVSISLLAVILLSFIYMRIRSAKLQEKIHALHHSTRHQIIELQEKARIAKDEERKRLGLELHDDLAATLAALKYKTELMVMNSNDPVQKKQLHDIAERLNRAYDITRGKSHEWYKPSAFDVVDASFPARVNSILQETLPNTYQTEITIDDYSLQNILLQHKIYLLLIIQECVTNILKHAKAHKVEILLYGDNENVILSINDDGKGMDTKNINRSGIGLKSIQQFVREMLGAFNISSKPGEGTCINIIIPSGDSFL
ncbi:sensor histidine kinase [Taibaiella soli]|uniref:Oxygen sensor histidine kinase NreB n=1 Tax=Taibaiella soli TaxID=1649169 RepID=A0A2W2AB29_9BACT|nr:ATP-binding protein [Taibaiella soli]PZF72501.1 hypothetical protein DN068_11590 [Taibaiella soli]